MPRDFNSDGCSQKSSFFRRQLHVDHFDGESAEVADYLSHFERVAKWNGWSHEEKGIQLAMNLREAARKVLGCLTDFEVDDYDVLCSVLKMKFSPKERVPMYRSEFTNRKKSNGDSVSDFGFSLSRLVNRADGDLPWDARETIVVEQFIHGLDDTDLKRHVCFFVIQVL